MSGKQSTADKQGDGGRRASIVFSKTPYLPPSVPCRISELQFSVQPPTEVVSYGEVEVFCNRLYKLPERTPHPGGPLDLSLGPGNKKHTCSTCGGKIATCSGHFGYIKLVLPVFHYGYATHILKILQRICKTCSRVLLSEEERAPFLRRLRRPNVERKVVESVFKKVGELAKRHKYCPCCGSFNAIVKKIPGEIKFSHHLFTKNELNQRELEDELSTVIQYTPEAKAAIPRATEDLNPVMVLELFRKIADEELPLLDCAWRPEHLICTHLQVPPCIIRPSVDVEGTGGSNEDDATMRLKHIIDLNGSLRKAVEEGLSRPELVVEKWEELQCACALYINGDFQVSLTRREAAGDMMARPMKGFVQRLKGKQGRFRGNLSGKRVDFSGRTVISPDPNVRVDEVCVPQHMAQVLTYPETVTEYNIDKLRARVRSGPLYPGANFVRVPNGNLFALKLANRAVVANELKIGDVVERHLENGDVVLFNRQPSLHRVSIMAHRARVMPWRTLRFNECVCSPYNADFDGDEMNLHVPQTEEARAEAIVLMRSVNNLATPKNGEILIAATQDFLTSAFLMTCKDVFYTRSEFSQVCNYMGDATTPVDLPTPAILKPMELWTGKQLWSVLVRPNAQTRIFLNLSHAEKTYTKKGEDMCPKDGWVLIRNSCLICGRLGKTTLGGNKGGLFGRLNTDYSPEVAAECMNRLAKMSARFLGNRGFTIGIDDVTPAVRLQNAKTDKIEKSYAECDEYIAQFKKGVLQLQPGCNEEQSLEQAVTGVLNNIREAAGKVCMDTLHWHNAPLIMSQCGSKGSPINIAQMVACVGQQSVAGKRCPFGFRNRTLPHFPRGDRTPAGRGFVANSFYTGLSATEFFFHTMAGREGLVDTAVKTAETGYMSRRLMKALEDLYAHYDGTVRNASNSIVQLRYGDDGLDPVLMEGKGESPLDLARTIHQIRAWTDIVQRVAPVPGRGDALLPEELEQEAAQQLQRLELQESSDACSLKYREEVTRFLNGLVEQYGRFRDRLQLPRSSRGEPALEHAAAQAGVTRWQLQLLVEQCVRGVERKRVDSATTVGAISAQSIGEPGTQMTLKTFHFAGVASMNVTLGVPRIKEIINATRKIATPIIDVALAVSDSEHAARIVKGRLEKTALGQVCSAIKMVVKHGVAYVSVRLDLERIQKLQLDLDAWQVHDIIRAVTKGRSKCGFGKVDVQVRRKDKLLVFPSRDDKTETARSGSSALRKASSILFDLQCILANLPHVVVSGIPTLERAVINKDKPKPGAAGGERFNLLVEGVGLQAVMSTPGVNGPETKTNHITEVETFLGIEAARSCIISEIKRTMESHGLGVDARHVMLLADVMTYKGRILGITRFGITDMKESTLHTASFERTTDQLFDAAVRGFRDEVTGVSEAIILGMLMPTGTGLFQIRHRHQPAAEQDAPVKRPPPLLQSFPLLPSYTTATG